VNVMEETNEAMKNSTISFDDSFTALQGSKSNKSPRENLEVNHK